MSAFDVSLAKLLVHEGGYVNNPRDPGGRTNLGVTQRVWEEYTGKPANESVMRSLTVAKVAPVYKSRYWTPLCCDALPPALAHCVFDFGVNAGVSRSAKYLQKLVGASVDGQVGPATLRALQAMVTREGLASVVRAFQQSRRTYYHSLSTFDTFGRGWLRRVDGVETESLRMLP